MRPTKIGSTALAILTLGLSAAVSCSHSTTSSSGSPTETRPSLFQSQPGLAHAAALQQGPGASIADITEATMPSVVNVSTTRTSRGPANGPELESDPFFRQFFGDQGVPRRDTPRDRREQGLGSGVIVSADGLVLTNNHVIENADDIRVNLADGRELKAKLLGSDPGSDVAVLKLQGDVKNLKPLRWGDSDRLRLGDVVLAIGNPFGVGQAVTMGIVSAKGRANVGILDYEDFIQTDAAINPGNSGGALVDLEGNLVGINTAILSRSGGNQGIGFAIPSSMARRVMDSLVRSGKVVRAWLGVAIQDLTPDLAKALGVGESRGVLIADVTPDSPARRAGLERGDLVQKLDGVAVDSSSRFRNLVSSRAVGSPITLMVLRGGKTVTLHASLGEAPAKGAGGGDGGAIVGESAGPLGGVSVAELDRATRETYRIPDVVRQGVAVTDVSAGSPAAEAGVQPGDVIVEINRAPVDSTKRFAELSRKAKDRALLLVQRGPSSIYIVLQK